MNKREKNKGIKRQLRVDICEELTSYGCTIIHFSSEFMMFWLLIAIIFLFFRCSYSFSLFFRLPLSLTHIVTRSLYDCSHKSFIFYSYDERTSEREQDTSHNNPFSGKLTPFNEMCVMWIEDHIATH
jgi:hypothetical protein